MKMHLHITEWGVHIKLFVEYLYGSVEVLQIILGISDTVV
jgi:hypothetical protein